MGFKMREIHVFDSLGSGGQGGTQKSPNRTPPKKCVRLIVILLKNFDIFGLGGGDPRMRPRMRVSCGRLLGQQAAAKPEQEMDVHMFGNVGLDRRHMPNPNKK